MVKLFLNYQCLKHENIDIPLKNGRHLILYQERNIFNLFFAVFGFWSGERGGGGVRKINDLKYLKKLNCFFLQILEDVFIINFYMLKKDFSAALGGGGSGCLSK